MSGVHTGPGATESTRIPRSASSWDRFFLKFTMAALVEASSSRPVLGWYAWTDDVSMMLAPGRRCGSAAWHSQTMAKTFVRYVRSSCSVVSDASPSNPIWYAALSTSTSMPPSASTARATMAWQCAPSWMSPGTATPRRPAPSIQRSVSRASSLLVGEVGDEDVGTLASEGDGDGATDAGVTAGDDEWPVLTPVDRG